MVRRGNQVRFMVRVRGYMSVDSPKLFFFRLGVGFRVSNVVSTVCKQ